MALSFVVRWSRHALHDRLHGGVVGFDWKGLICYCMWRTVVGFLHSWLFASNLSIFERIVLVH